MHRQISKHFNIGQVQFFKYLPCVGIKFKLLIKICPKRKKYSIYWAIINDETTTAPFCRFTFSHNSG